MDEGEQGLLAARLEPPFDLLLAPEMDEAAGRIGLEDLAVSFQPFILAESLGHLLGMVGELGIAEDEGELAARAQIHVAAGEPGAAQLRLGEIVPDPLGRRRQQPLKRTAPASVTMPWDRSFALSFLFGERRLRAHPAAAAQKARTPASQSSTAARPSGSRL